MRTEQTRESQEHDRRWTRAWRGALGVSLLFHALLVLLFWGMQPPLPEVPEAAAGPRAGDPAAASGGGLEMIAFRVEEPPPVPVEIERPPEPVPVPDPVVQPVEPPKEPTQPLSGTGNDTPAGQGQGDKTGPGTDTGTGRGDGGTGEEGLYRQTAPSPRGLILPPSDRPNRVKGKSVTVYVFVTERGRVVADSTRLAPSSGDSGFDKRLKQQASEWQFRPGTRGGSPIASWFEYTITL